MNFQEAVEILVNYVEVMDEGTDKIHFCEIINKDFLLDQKDVAFFNRMIEDDTMPLNIRLAIQMVMKEKIDR